MRERRCINYATASLSIRLSGGGGGREKGKGKPSSPFPFPLPLRRACYSGYATANGENEVTSGPGIGGRSRTKQLGEELRLFEVYNDIHVHKHMRKCVFSLAACPYMCVVRGVRL